VTLMSLGQISIMMLWVRLSCMRWAVTAVVGNVAVDLCPCIYKPNHGGGWRTLCGQVAEHLACVHALYIVRPDPHGMACTDWRSTAAMASQGDAIYIGTA
jgi:hypothetical protein